MSRPFKILYLANTGKTFGGGQISLLELLKGMDRERFQPVVSCPRDEKLAEEVRKLNIETVIIKMKSLRSLNVFSWIITVKKLLQLIKEKNIDLIHSNGSRPTVYGGIASKLTSVPLIWHVRIADYDKFLDRVLAYLCKKMIVVSRAAGKRFYWLKDKNNKVVVIYNGVDLEKFNPYINGQEIRKEFGISPEAPSVGMVARMDGRKGHRYFLQAAKKITELMPEVRFLIVGDGEYRQEFEALKAELGLDKKVLFTGNRKDIPSIMASIDVFVLPSINEAFSRAVVEAMACAKPVVATGVGGLLEIVEDAVTGNLVPPKNADTLTEAIIALLKNKEKAKRMGQAGRERAEKLCDIKKNIRRTQEVYEQILQYH